jgi:hypothetical protein
MYLFTKIRYPMDVEFMISDTFEVGPLESRLFVPYISCSYFDPDGKCWQVMKKLQRPLMLF